jgi:hypothetical protein
MQRLLSSVSIPQLAIVVFAGASIVWSVLSLPLSEASGEYRDIGTRLLRLGHFGQAASASMLSSPVAQRLSLCDTHAQRAMLLLEMPLAETALRTGAAKEFDQRIASLEGRVRSMLTCSPRDAFVWLTAFNLNLLHGIQDARSFDLLATSFETSPNEAWIGVRRTVVAAPHLMRAPEPLRAAILAEFRQLISTGYVANAAAAYLNAPPSARTLLQQQVDQLSREQQRSFAEALQSRRLGTSRAL